MSFQDNILYNLCHCYNLFSILLKDANCIEESTQAKKETKYFYNQFKRRQSMASKVSQKQSILTKNLDSISELNSILDNENSSSHKSFTFEDIESFNVTNKGVLLKIYCKIDGVKYKITIVLCKEYSCLVIYVYNKSINFLQYIIMD